MEFRRHEPPAFVDRPDAGPSVISTATLEAVASWFDDMPVEVGGVPAFREDRFVGSDAPGFIVDGDDVSFEGYEPCAVCRPEPRPEDGRTA
nr:hypothetical protein [Haloplanus sp. HW8-1]